MKSLNKKKAEDAAAHDAASSTARERADLVSQVVRTALDAVLEKR